MPSLSCSSFSTGRQLRRGHSPSQSYCWGSSGRRCWSWATGRSSMSSWRAEPGRRHLPMVEMPHWRLASAACYKWLGQTCYWQRQVVSTCWHTGHEKLTSELSSVMDPIASSPMRIRRLRLSASRPKGWSQAALPLLRLLSLSQGSEQ